MYTFLSSVSKQVNQARKALFSLSFKAQRLSLPLDIQCGLFDHLVLPVLMYGCEVWGFENLTQIENFHRKFLRSILKVNKCTPDCMVYGETGRTYIEVHIKCRMIGFWLKIVKGSQCKYTFRLSFFKVNCKLQHSHFVKMAVIHRKYFK